ncbi:hypothetical protein [Mycolicibacterium aubagnense]|uniref:SCP domain-containing protein n=1 Tax=Mycolicibacterium aubagnense TaxID=319707 RepID=A0ABN5Z224_9MYCO|nr:hypothetical protein [Mycolicibacterium aubagnense]TLH49069.1 hypothetical protein C1S80_29055 [Mycolicibacterium aubagnense]BBX88233.1 hypothetical protein MAUB_64340 [Mycolicibacterium aubagnense]
MTTYAPPPVLAPDQTPAYWQTTPPGGGLPPRPLRTGGRRRGVVAAWVAVAAAAAAVAVSAVNLSTPQAAPVHTTVVPAGPATYTTDQVAAAKQQTCAAWKTASAQMAGASNAAADAPPNWSNPDTKNALAAEARTTLAESAYLRSQIGDATPLELTGPIHDYLVASFDMEHWTMRRNGPNRHEAIGRSNIAANKVDAACT